MASPTSPTHGKEGAIYRIQKNGFNGAGLNDLTWGTGYNGVASASFEVVIDATGTPDTFKWRKNGGAWTSGVVITGGAQTLSDTQTVTFGATTGHTLNDKWSIGNLKDEGCTESGTTAQITDSTKRILNPNNPPTFTDSGGAKVLWIDFTSGTAHFSANVATVTVTGNNGFVLESAMEKIGYVIDWNMTVDLEMADISAMGDKWKTSLPGMGGGSGSANKYFIGSRTFFGSLTDEATGTLKYHFLKLFTYDPDQDETGDHFNAWAYFTGLNVNAPIGQVVQEQINFTLCGKPTFTANT